MISIHQLGINNIGVYLCMITKSSADVFRLTVYQLRVNTADWQCSLDTAVNTVVVVARVFRGLMTRCLWREKSLNLGNIYKKKSQSIFVTFIVQTLATLLQLHCHLFPPAMIDVPIATVGLDWYNSWLVIIHCWSPARGSFVAMLGSAVNTITVAPQSLMRPKFSSNS